MDYWQHLDVHFHPSWDAFTSSKLFPQRIWLFSTHAKTSLWSANFQSNDALLFGNEGHGCPDWLHQQLHDNRLTLPRFNEKPLRSLNLSTSVGIATYEALRQVQALP
jgi:tRNA (cytidine/uridine-2'-O-)-methyltransferase